VGEGLRRLRRHHGGAADLRGFERAVARAYVKAALVRCVWGSDWPHPTEQQKVLPDDAVLFDLLGDRAPDEKVRHRILVEPAQLYDFSA